LSRWGSLGTAYPILSFVLILPATNVFRVPFVCFMARAPKKLSTVKKAKPRRPLVKTSKAKHEQTIAELRHELAESLQRENATAKKLQESNRELTEVLEQ